MAEHDVIIVGAGAAGLNAAYELTKAGKNVLVIEALDYLGGRIHTYSGNGFTAPVELGAEFVHGNLPVSLALLKEAGIKYYTSSGGKMVNARDGNEDSFMQGWDVLEDKLKEVQEDMSVDDFLNKYFSEEKYAGLKSSVRGFVEGYDNANTADASIIAFRDEWLSDENASQYRIEGGYGKLVDYLAAQIKIHGGVFHLSSPVKEVKWKAGFAEIITSSGKSYTSDKVIVTVPIGVLRARVNETGSIKFSPDVPQIIKAAGKIGYGSVLKILFEFKDAFWTGKEARKATRLDMSKMGFLFSGEAIPTWWTQYPNRSALLTGWLGGPKAEKYKSVSDDEIYKVALHSLSNIFKVADAEMESRIVASKIVNWGAEPYTKGSYAYTSVETPAVRAILNQPVENTLYFAGEANYDGPEMGTVEAALASGLKAAKDIIT